MHRFLGTLIAVAACGGGGSSPPIALDSAGALDGVVDAAVDAAPDAPAPTEVRVQIAREFPAGFNVLFYAPDHQLVAQLTTDDTGVVAAALPQGGTVLVIPDPVTGSWDDVRAVFGVEAGDEIRLAEQFGTQNGDQMTLTVPSHPSGGVYRAETRCTHGGSSTTTMTLFGAPGCQGLMPVLAVVDVGSFEVVAAQRGTITVGNMQNATLAGPWLDLETASLTVVNSSPDLLRVQSWVYPVLEDTPLSSLGSFAIMDVAASATGTSTYVTPPVSTVDGRLFGFPISRPGRGGGQGFQRVLPANQTATQFDAATELLPWYGPNNYDAPARRIPLARSAGVALDGQIVDIEFFRDEGFDHVWHCVIPPTWDEVVLPPLPAEFTEHDPDHFLVIGQNIINMIGVSASSYNGYADFRRGAPVSTAVGSFHNITRR